MSNPIRERIIMEVRAFASTYHRGPSLDDIARRVGLSSKATVFDHVHRLEKEGRVTRTTDRRRAIVAVDGRCCTCGAEYMGGAA